MANTYINLASTTLSSAQSVITFSSISQSYTDLVLRISGLSDSGSGNWYTVRFNGDTATNYSTTRLRSQGDTPSTGREASATSLYNNGFDFALSVTANTHGNSEIYIPNYTANANKPLHLFNTTAGSTFLTSVAGLWRNTAAINSITITTGFGSYNSVAGSDFYLYGIKKD
jgi:hypothetical protein